MIKDSRITDIALTIYRNTSYDVGKTLKQRMVRIISQRQRALLQQNSTK